MMNTPHPRPKIAVIGAGWAGLSAAVTLARHADVTLFEAGRQAGGRARALAGNTDGFGFLDNGQHILLGAYRGVLRLMKTIGSDPRAAFLRVPLHWHMHGGLQFRTLPLPAPLHILGGVLLARRVPSAFKAKLLADMSDLQKSARLGQPDTTVAQWLKQRNVPCAAVMQFWQPLVWGALNTPLETASLRVLCNVLSDGVLTKKSGSDYLLPKQDLGAIVAEPALAELQRLGADIRLETRVCRLNTLPDGKVLVNGEAFDAAVPATAPYHAAALLPEGTPEHVQTAYQNLRYHAITTVYLRSAEPVPLPAPLTGLADGTVQWLLCRGRLGLPENEVSAVISVSDRVGAFANRAWADKAHADLKRILPHLGEPEAVRVITEKRATTAADAPPPDLSWLHRPRIFPAGDYLHPDYPATLEAAVQSGFASAEACLQSLSDAV
ncbi:oxidoreductase [Neisseria meningitidis]|uniref:hydroxysqualene dehydroxylase HpnE n=1 Tax=Neisseria meningitidis TaxID=487 RepID=UPI000F54B034|nr:hydroxysqualene dehydroxylase HpnE [Neisseria meningitidis]RQK06990.1 oxidoreductase [Neisseria meningitidis]